MSRKNEIKIKYQIIQCI